MMVPIYGFLEGDTMGLLVLAQDGDTVADVAAKLQRSASIRVAPHERVRVLHAGRALDPTLTVARSGLAALDCIHVVSDKSNASRGGR